MNALEARRRLLMMVDELPWIYRRVEYLEATGTQRILTGVSTSKTVPTEYDVVIGYWNPNSKRQLTGADYGAYFGINASGNAYEFGTNTSASPSENGYDSIHFEQDLQNNKQYLIINGTTFTRSFSNWADKNILLFNIYNDATYNCCCRIKTFRIKQGGVLVKNFIPCVRKSDDKPGMYDTVTKAFYTNVGTGEFIVPTA